MNLTPAQSDLVNKVEQALAALKTSNKPEIQQALKNLEWNAKKVKGGSGGETISPDEWAKDTKYDLTQVAKSIGGSGAQSATGLIAEIDRVFGSTTSQVTAGGEPAVAAAPAAATAAAASTTAGVDVNTLLSGLAAKSGEQLDWKNSLVDLLKTLGADSSLAGRKKVAAAVGWTEAQISTVGSETGNQSLHTAILTYLTTHGGKLPA
jgi:hypothetical protein